VLAVQDKIPNALRETTSACPELDAVSAVKRTRERDADQPFDRPHDSTDRDTAIVRTSETHETIAIDAGQVSGREPAVEGLLEDLPLTFRYFEIVRTARKPV